MGRPDASREDVERAARAVRAHDFISALPQGHDTVLAESGGSLAGGERGASSGPSCTPGTYGRSRERADHDVVTVRIAESELSGPGGRIRLGLLRELTDKRSGA